MQTEGPELFLEWPGLSVVQGTVVFAQVNLAVFPRLVTGAPGPQVRGRMGRTSLDIMTHGACRGHSQASAGPRDFDSRFVQR